MSNKEIDKMSFEKTIIKEKFNFLLWFKKFNAPKWIAFFGLFIFAISYVFTIRDFINAINGPNADASTIWFGIIDRFTNQSNWLLFIYCFLYVFFSKNSLLKGNGLLISVMVYIFFTFIGYNVVLVGLSGGAYGYGGSNLGDTVSNVWLHLLCPIYFLVFGYFEMYYNPNKEPKKFWKLLLLGMIYPTIYMIYVITIPYTYGSYTETIDGVIVPETYTVYGNATNVKDYPTAWAYVMVMYLIFFPGSFAIFYFSWKGLNKINNKKIENKKTNIEI